MKRLLYLMHIPWGWIKQRPHFLAAGTCAVKRSEEACRAFARQHTWQRRAEQIAGLLG